MAAPERIGLLLCDDLIFNSRITGVARDLGLPMVAARTVADLLALAAQQPPACAILDLHNAGADIGTLVAQLREHGEPFIVGYGSHVDAATLHRAREAGCDLVLPRSKFVEQLPAELPAWFRGRAQP